MGQGHDDAPGGGRGAGDVGLGDGLHAGPFGLQLLHGLGSEGEELHLEAMAVLRRPGERTAVVIARGTGWS